MIQSALASSELLFAILSVSAVSFLALTNPPRTALLGSAGAEKCHETVSVRDAVGFKVVAVKLLRSAIEGHTAPKAELLLYCVLCLLVTEVMSPESKIDCTILRCSKIVVGDTDAIKVHTSALRELMQSRNGYENMPGHVIDTLVS